MIAGLFYFALENLDPKFRSTLDSICLLAIVKFSVIQTYGVDVILEPFVEAVQKLEVAIHISKRITICTIRMYVLLYIICTLLHSWITYYNINF